MKVFTVTNLFKKKKNLTAEFRSILENIIVILTRLFPEMNVFVLYGCEMCE